MSNKLYTAEKLISKFDGKYINTYPHFYEKSDAKTGKWITLYEVREVSSTIRENCNPPKDCIV